MIINTNMASLNTIRQLGINQKATANSLAKLSSGLKINSAADDAAGLAISEKMRGQISGLNKASSNCQDAISLTSTAEGALNETTSVLQRMRELAVQASSDTLTASDRSAVQDETNQLRQTIDNIANTTQFNTKNLLNGSIAQTITAGGVAATHIDATKSIAGANTQSGVYNVVFTQAATQGTTGLQANATTNTTGITVANSTTTDLGTTYNGAIQVNGQSVTISAGDTAKNIIDKINNVTANSGVTASLVGDDTNDYIQLASNGYGGKSTVSLTASNNQMKKLFAGTTGTATTISASGTDAVGTINAVAATGQGNTLTLNSAGNAADGLAVVGIDGLVANADAATITVGNSNTLTFQIGANAGQNMNLAINNMGANALSVATDGSSTGAAGLDLSTASKASTAITTIDNAINKVSSERSKLGAVQNRLEHTINNLGTASQNITGAEANIRDVDMAAEMTNFQKNNILQQAAQAMLAQANQQPQGVLQLLR